MIPGFEKMDDQEQRKYIDGMAKGMLEGVKNSFKDDVSDLPEFIVKMLIMRVEDYFR